MPTEPPLAPGRMPPEASAGRRLHIHGIKEMPAGYDAEVAELFRDLRAASNLSEIDLAATLATRPEVVQALEQGALYALPPWPETSRVVNSYGLLLNLDVRPLLRRIYAQIEQDMSAELRPMQEPPSMAPRGPLDIPFETEARMPAPQPYAEPKRPQPSNWAPQPVDRRMQTRGGAEAPAPRRPEPQPRQLPPQARPPQPSPPQARAPQSPPPQSRPPQSQPPQARAPQSPQPPPQTRAPQALPPKPQQTQASAAPTPKETKAPANKKNRTRLLKWGIAVLIVVGAVYGLLSLRSGPSLVGASSPQSGAPLDPNDPRAHKADRLPSPQ